MGTTVRYFELWTSKSADKVSKSVVQKNFMIFAFDTPVSTYVANRVIFEVGRVPWLG